MRPADEADHFIGVAQDLVVGEPQDQQPGTRQQPVALHILGWRRVVLLPVGLETNRSLLAVEVHDVWPQRLLATELEAVQSPSPNVLPKQLLSRRGCLA